MSEVADTSEVADYKLVRDSSVGTELTEEKAKMLAAKMGVRHLKDGEILIREGEDEQTLFLLVMGKLAVISRDTDGVDKHVYTMREGECAGTRAFVKQSKRRATLRALGDATVYTLEPADFENLLDANPRLAYMVMRALFRITHANLARVNQESQELTNYITKTHGRY